MLEASGVGDYKYEKYGEQFLDVIADWKRENVEIGLAKCNSNSVQCKK